MRRRFDIEGKIKLNSVQFDIEGGGFESSNFLETVTFLTLSSFTW